MPEVPHSRIALIIAVASIFLGSWLILMPAGNLAPKMADTLGLTVILLGLWATAVIPEYLTALIFFLLAMLLQLAPKAVIFGGFQSTALWLILAGLVIGVAIRQTGLGQRIADLVSGHLHGSYAHLISGCVAIGLIFGFLMPSAMGRVVLLVPVALAVADHFGFVSSGNGRRGVLLAFVLGSFLPGFAILPSNVANMVLVGMSETIYGFSPLYGEYLLLHFPVLGLLKAIVVTGLILWMFPDTPARSNEAGSGAKPGLTSAERQLSVLLMLLLLFWMTDFLHHVSPAWIALAGAVYLLLPRVGLLDPVIFNSEINFASLFFVAGILGMGAMISESGIGNRLAQLAIEVLPLADSHPFLQYMSLGLSAIATGVVATISGIPAIHTPVAEELAAVTGLPLKTVVMTQVLGYSTVLFPYTAPPVVIGMQMAGERVNVALKFCLVLAFLTVFILLPLDYLWWSLLGWL